MKTSTKIMIAATAAILVFSCGKIKNYKGDDQIAATFAYSRDVMPDYFYTDSVYVDGEFAYSEILVFCNNATDLTPWSGGCGLSIGADTTVLTNVIYPYRVWGVRSVQGDNIYAFWHDAENESLMPEHDFITDIYFGDDDSYIIPQFVYVKNTQQVVNEVRYGLNIGTPFQEGDYITLSFKGFFRDKGTGTVSVNLADFKTYRDSVMTVWTPIDLTSLGKVDAIDFEITSNRPVSKDFCFDNLVVNTHIEY